MEHGKREQKNVTSAGVSNTTKSCYRLTKKSKKVQALGDKSETFAQTVENNLSCGFKQLQQ